MEVGVLGAQHGPVPELLATTALHGCYPDLLNFFFEVLIVVIFVFMFSNSAPWCDFVSQATAPPNLASVV